MAASRQTAGELARLPICVDDNPDMSMDRVRSSARLLQSKGKCDFIIIDYLQLCDMRTEQNNRNREQEVAQASRKAKLLAKELHIPVILLSQLNRGSENRRTDAWNWRICVRAAPSSRIPTWWFCSIARHWHTWQRTSRADIRQRGWG